MKKTIKKIALSLLVANFAFLGLAQNSTYTSYAAEEQLTVDYQKQKEQRRLEQQRKRQLEDIESKIAAYEEELEYKKAELFQEEVYLDTQKSAQVQARIEELEELIMESMETWEELSLS